jgi:hypothetical protein
METEASTDTRLSLLEQSDSYIQLSLGRIEKQVNTISDNINKIHLDVNLKIESKFEKIEKNIITGIKWLIGVFITLLTASSNVASTLLHFLIG